MGGPTWGRRFRCLNQSPSKISMADRAASTVVNMEALAMIFGQGSDGVLGYFVNISWTYAQAGDSGRGLMAVVCCVVIHRSEGEVSTHRGDDEDFVQRHPHPWNAMSNESRTKNRNKAATSDNNDDGPRVWPTTNRRCCLTPNVWSFPIPTPCVRRR